MSRIWLIIPAAGVGQRFGAATPKQYQTLLDKTILEQTLARFAHRADIQQIILVVAKDDIWIKQIPLPANVVLVEGGAERVDSVKAGLHYLSAYAKDDDLVAVHDAARPCVRSDMLDRLFQQAKQQAHGVLPVLMARETVKQVKDGKIIATLDRREIALAQTPQVFFYGLLQQALATEVVVTDEASAVEALGLQPCAILGDPDNIKITLPQDMKVAEIALTEILEQERQA